MDAQFAVMEVVQTLEVGGRGKSQYNGVSVDWLWEEEGRASTGVFMLIHILEANSVVCFRRHVIFIVGHTVI